MKGEMIHDDESSSHCLLQILCVVPHILVETAFIIISMLGMKRTAAFWIRYFLKRVFNIDSLSDLSYCE